VLRPLLLTGPPAVGKSSAARALAGQQRASALIEVDDLRQFVIAGAAPAWEPGEGARQTRLAATHACVLMSSFADAGFSVIATDVLLWDAGLVYRSHTARPLIVHLSVALEEALRRAATRRVHLTDQEFRQLHACERGADFADAEVDTTELTLAQLTAVLAALWSQRGQA
jgi:chloramphenicol 3-O-phosphotransferase